MLAAADCEHLDAQSDLLPIAALRERFAPGADRTLYFDANSIGPMPASAPARVNALLEDGWRVARRRGWNDTDWLAQPRLLGAAIAPMIGAEPEDVRVADTTSVNLYKLLRHALSAAAPRRAVVFERDVFSSNRYVALGLAQAGLADLRPIAHISELAAALAPGDVAVVALSHVDYRSSERLDMAVLTAQAHAAGALALWDLSHSAGAVAVHLRASNADLAVGCGYKYLCGGPGAPAFLYVHPRLQDAAWPAIAGWMGHADTFAFAADYAPAPGVDRFLVGTPAVIANAAFACAADIWREVAPADVDARHRSLTDTLIRLLDEQCDGLGLNLASPREHARRGGHVALRFDSAAALCEALVDRGVIVSARKPDALRFGVHPLTTRHIDLWHAVQVLRGLLVEGAWRRAEFNRPAV